MPSWSDGEEAAKLLADEDKKRRGSGRFRVQQYSFKKGDPPVFFRPYTDRRARGDHPGWISVDLHQYAPTKDKPAEFTGENWPPKMWGVCPLDRMFRVRGADGQPTDEYEPGYGDCYLHTALAGKTDEKYGFDLSKPSAQVLGLVVIREPVLDASGACTGFKDKEAEWVDDKGNITKIPYFAVMNQRFEHFWAPIAAACFLDKTACNKDFQLSRNADNKTTVQAVNTDPSFAPGTDLWKAKYDATLELIGFDIREYILDAASPDHYARWFIPGATPKGGYGRQSGNGATEGEDAGGVTGNGAAPASGVDQAAMADFAASLATRGANAG